MERIRILLADDHREMLSVVTGLLADEFDIVAAVENGRLAVEAAGDLDPDVIVLDMAMPVMHGLEAAVRLRDSGSRAKIIFLTVQAQAESIAAAFSAGALGYVLKSRIASDLVLAVREVVEGRIFSPMHAGVTAYIPIAVQP
jgi:DNA-binding NarL/FixJ family response regulator